MPACQASTIKKHGKDEHVTRRAHADVGRALHVHARARRDVDAGCIFTDGADSGIFSQKNAPNAFEGANSIILTPDRRFLFATNGGHNSVSSFAVGVDGKLTLVDAKRIGNVVAGRSGTAKALAYSPSHSTLFVLQAFGPDPSAADVGR